MSISVIIPTFNRAAVVAEAIASVYAGGVDDVEVLVVDDGSTDETAEAVRRFDRVRYVRQKNGGPASARNRGIRMARGETVAFLDSDDVFRPGKLANDVRLLAAHPEAAAVVSDASVWVAGELSAASWFRARGLPVEPGPPRLLSQYPPAWAHMHMLAPSAMAIRSAALRRIGPFDETLRSFEDWDFELRMISACDVLVCAEPLLRIRRFDDGTRADRPIPGTAFSPEQWRISLTRREIVLRRTLARDAWSGAWRAELAAELENVTRALARA
jgi:glycosyltransferase involved in cell wall biosynthesis